MVGITLSSEQIRSAPPEIRRWLERQVVQSLGLQVPAAAPEPRPKQLAICSGQELNAMLTLMRGILPAVNVFFELGHLGKTLGNGELEVFRLIDIAHQARLQSAGQVATCLNIMNQAIRQVRRDAEATFCVLDGEHCYIAAQTQRNIGRLWQELVERQQIDGEAPLMREGPDPVAVESGSASDVEPRSAMPPAA